MPRKPQPLSVLQGNGKKHLTKKEIQERKEAEETIQPNKDKIEMPKWLDKEAKAEWNRIIDELLELDILTNIDIAALALCCDAYSKYIQAHRKVKRHGLMMTELTKYGEKLVKNPAVTIQKQYAEIYKQFMSEFGLSPSARLKLVSP